MFKKALVLFCLLTACSTNNHLWGTLSEEVEMPPYCGTEAYTAVLKFDVEGEELLLEVPCPGDYGNEFFVKGARYQFIIADSGWDIPVIRYNEYEDEELKIHWAEQITRQYSLPIPPERYQ